MRIQLRNFEFVKLESLAFDLSAETSTSGRVYATPTGEKYPSITTVLSSFNKKALFDLVGCKITSNCFNKSNKKLKGVDNHVKLLLIALFHQCQIKYKTE